MASDLCRIDYVPTTIGVNTHEQRLSIGYASAGSKRLAHRQKQRQAIETKTSNIVDAHIRYANEKLLKKMAYLEKQAAKQRVRSLNRA